MTFQKKVRASLSTNSFKFKGIFQEKSEASVPTYSLSLNVFSGKSESLSADIFPLVYMNFQKKK